MKHEFSAGTVYSIVHNLLGEIEPIGESNYDNQCFDNIREYDQLMSMLMDDIQLLLPYRRRYEGSMKTMGNYAESLLKGMRMKIDEWLEEYDE